MLGKRVKKLVYQNRFTLPEIACLCNSTVEECTTAYENYTGKKILASFLIAGNEKQRNQLRKLILNNEKILLFGEHGVGKSSLPRLIASEIGWQIKYSYPRNTEDLLKDFAQLPLQTRNTIFVVEGDSFYWRAYALINFYVKESKNPFIVIVNKKDTVHATVAKQMTPLKLQAPTRKDVEQFVKKKYPDWQGDIEDIYDSDMRVTLRNILSGIKSFKPIEEEKLSSQQVAYKILTGKCEKKDFENCEHPFIFILNWLGNNLHKFYSSVSPSENLSFVDTYKYDYKQKYLNGILLNFGKHDKRAKMNFPPIKFKPKEEKEDWLHGKKKKTKPKETKEQKKQKEKKQATLLRFTGDMVL